MMYVYDKTKGNKGIANVINVIISSGENILYL